MSADEANADEDVADLSVSEDEADIIAAEATAAARVLPPPGDADAARLADAARTGLLPADLIDTLTDVATASLEGGRARRLYRAEGEKLLAAVLGRTPAGRQRRRELDEVNTALAGLSGRQLNGVRVASRSPGNHTVRFEADGFTITLGVTARGVTVQSVAA